MADFPVGGLKLVFLRLPLRSHSSVRSFAIQLAAGAVVKSSVDVDPNLGLRVTHIDRRGRSLG